jgi:hypothetical protein
MHLLAMFFFMGFAFVSSAATINYAATDLVDINPGEDLWQYSYSLSDHNFAADTGFTIYFDLGLYDFLEPLPAAPNADWDVITWSPDLFFFDDGAYDAYSLIDSASLADLFRVSFVWLGGGAGPGSQNFEIYDGLTWSVLEPGITSSTATPVPEPSTIFLLGLGLLGIFSKRIKNVICNK